MPRRDRRTRATGGRKPRLLLLYPGEVLFVGHPYYLKGVDLLIEAFKRVAASHPEWRLKGLGWFPEPREIRAAIGDHPRIQLHPPVSHAGVAEHMGRCGIFVLPSRTEAMGRVLLEAAACRKPRVGSRVGGIPTVIEDEVDGLLFAPEDVDELATQLDRLMGDPALRGSRLRPVRRPRARPGVPGGSLPAARPPRHAARDGANVPAVHAAAHGAGPGDPADRTFTLFTMSSRSEGTSIALLEAMSSGLCPVVAAVGGNPAVLGSDLSHRLCPPEDRYEALYSSAVASGPTANQE